MNISIYKEIEKEYDKKRQQAIRVAEENLSKIYLEIPKLSELEEEKNRIAIEHTIAMATKAGIDKEIEEENIQKKLDDIESQIDFLLNSKGISKDDLKPKFECKRCKDTGIIENEGIRVRCSCFNQKIMDETYKQNNMLKLNEENFNTFDIAYFSNTTDKEKYMADKSPLDNIKVIREIAQDFCKNIKNPDQKSLLFIGNTGTGKTFISSCIASEVIKKGYTVIYQTAPILMDMILNSKFTYNKDDVEKEKYLRVFDVDLLIIDDLGTENMTNTKFTELFNIINTRLLKNKKTIISTNLMLPELASEYDERVMSRLIGNYTVCKFYGDDIRLKKKKMIDKNYAN